ncbi:MAG: hypothetical protein EA397_15740 [Deltaproteobacteria bacterium]|nr:MAG: hypothetical protein EA397_15740 [Deltaproteobacteria bacterium]
MRTFQTLLVLGLLAACGSEAETSTTARTDADTDTDTDTGFDTDTAYVTDSALPPYHPLTIADEGECDPLVPCGGNEVGTWQISGGCVEFDFGLIQSACAGAEVTRTEGRARGEITFESGIVDRWAQARIEADFTLPSECNIFGCAGMEGIITGAAGDMIDDVRCVDTDSGGCDCMARSFQTLDDGEPYTIDGDQIVGSTSGSRWDYCVTGGELRYEHVEGSGELEPGIVDLSKVE